MSRDCLFNGWGERDDESSGAVRAHYQNFFDVGGAAGASDQDDHGVLLRRAIFMKVREGGVEIGDELVGERENDVNWGDYCGASAAAR